MTRMTSAYANKMLKKLSDDKAYILSNEADASTYTATVEEEPVIPEYDYEKTARDLEEIDEKTVRIKHAINLANATNLITVGDRQMNADMILVRMAQLNNRLEKLDRMRKRLPKERVESLYSRKASTLPEYNYANYDIEQARKDYEAMSKTVLDMQMALDKYNQTVEFDVDVDM